MSTQPASPFALARTFVFRRYLTIRHRLTDLRAAAEAARLRRKQERHDRRMRDFYGWCEACRAFGSIF